MMKIKLLLDEDVHAALSAALRKRGYDVVHVSELQRKGKEDHEQLNYASEQQRCLVSFNVKDFVLLHYDYIRRGQENFGIIVSKQLSVGQTLSKLLNISGRFSQETIKNRLEFL